MANSIWFHKFRKTQQDAIATKSRYIDRRKNDAVTVPRSSYSDLRRNVNAAKRSKFALGIVLCNVLRINLTAGLSSCTINVCDDQDIAHCRPDRIQNPLQQGAQDSERLPFYCSIELRRSAISTIRLPNTSTDKLLKFFNVECM